MPGASSGVFHTSTELGEPAGVVLIKVAVVRVAHAAVRADFMVVAELEAVRPGDIRQHALEHVTRVVLPLNLVRSPRRATGDRAVRSRERAFVVHLPLCVGLPCLDEPQGRSARLLQCPASARLASRTRSTSSRLRAEAGCVSGDVHRTLPTRVMRVLGIAELRRARILPGAEVLALALPPPLDERRELVLRRGLPREAQRRSAHVGVEVRIDELAVGRRRCSPARR